MLTTLSLWILAVWHWIPFIFQYGVGGVVLVTGLVISVKSGACQLRFKADRVWFFALIAGFLWLALMHLLWMLAAFYIKGVPPG